MIQRRWDALMTKFQQSEPVLSKAERRVISSQLRALNRQKKSQKSKRIKGPSKQFKPTTLITY